MDKPFDIHKAINWIRQNQVNSWPVSEDAVGPVILERTCEFEEYGCGTKFRWFLGMPPICPKCGKQYTYTIEMLEKGEMMVRPK